MAASAVGFRVTTPIEMYGYETFLAAVRAEQVRYASGHPGIERDTVLWYVTYVWQVQGALTLVTVLEIARGIRAGLKSTHDSPRAFPRNSF